MIYYDVTKMGGARHKSGLMRVTSRLMAALGSAVQPVCWQRGAWVDAARRPIRLQPSDWVLTVELFGGEERPGLREFIAARPCRMAAVFHDAIPLKLPHVTWPHSVQRHPDYMKLLAGFDRVWAISEWSRSELTGFWAWQGVKPRARVDVIALGADFDGSPRAKTSPVSAGPASLLCVGIVEPRKNHEFLLTVAEELWRAGHDFDLHIAGRVNPHFGEPIARRIKGLAKREKRLRFHGAASDATLHALYASARAVVFPTIAEGCGLPLLEALWRGVPCVCSDLAVLRENADAGGCLTATMNDGADWERKLAHLLSDESEAARLRREAVARPLPTWAETGEALRRELV